MKKKKRTRRKKINEDTNLNHKKRKVNVTIGWKVKKSG